MYNHIKYTDKHVYIHIYRYNIIYTYSRDSHCSLCSIATLKNLFYNKLSKVLKLEFSNIERMFVIVHVMRLNYSLSYTYLLVKSWPSLQQ